MPGASGPSSLHGGGLKASLQQFVTYDNPDQGYGGTSRGERKVSHICEVAGMSSIVLFHWRLEFTRPYIYLRLPEINIYVSHTTQELQNFCDLGSLVLATQYR